MCRARRRRREHAFAATGPQLTVSPQFERALESHLATRARSVRHSYSLGEYGLRGDAVRARFSGYAEAMRSRGVVV